MTFGSLQREAGLAPQPWQGARAELARGVIAAMDGK